MPLDHDTPSAMHRARIDTPLQLGVRVLDTLTTVGKGQRMGLFAGSGVGKSSLLSMIARGSSAAVNVIALVGERGREVREFIDRDLGPAIERSVVVVATSDQPALVRIKAALTATAIAEHFRDQGHDVMLMMDSVTRFAMAQREVGLAIGELWELDALAEDCAADGPYEFLLCSAPLHVTGGIGSPANALAIK